MRVFIAIFMEVAHRVAAAQIERKLDCKCSLDFQVEVGFVTIGDKRKYFFHALVFLDVRQGSRV